jgi:hypothetical protein
MKKYDIERAIRNENAYASMPRTRGKKPGKLPTVTREASGLWHWWAEIKGEIRSGLSASKREACNERRLSGAAS